MNDIDNNSEEKPSGLLTSFTSIFKPKSDTTLREAIEELIEDNGEEGDSETSINSHEKTLISNILNMRDLPVIDVMIPRADINAINIETSKEDLLALLKEKPHSRLPIYRDDLDNVIGAINMKDIITHINEEEFKLIDIMRNVLIVSPSMYAFDLLLQMRQSKLHIAMVIDEFGGIDGLITINDLIEAIVGEIEDEHSLDVQPLLIKRPDGTMLIDARYDVDNFEKEYGEFMNDTERSEIDTFGGLINTTAGRVPARGEIISHHSGMEFEIIDADPRRINRIKLLNWDREEADNY